VKKYLVLIFLFSSLFIKAQVPSIEAIDAEKYRSATKWSCADKHFAYYFLSFSMPLPLDSKIENYTRSGDLRIGYTYRYKVVKAFDIGLELAYSNRNSAIKKEYYNIFDPTDYYNPGRIRTFHNSVQGGLYLRFNLGGVSYRKLGTYLDIGGFYDYAFSYGILYKTKNSDIKQKIRFKRPDYLSPENYGTYIRVGWNYISLILSYHFGDWITDFSQENMNFKRSPVTLGIQFNLYAR
jgi:hypothetical protein